VVDVSNPAEPFELAVIDTPDEAWDVEIVAGLAYVADGASGLRIIDFGSVYSSHAVPALGPLGRALLIFALAGAATSALRLRHGRQ